MRGLAGPKLLLWICLSATLSGCATRFADDIELRSVEAVYLEEGAAAWVYEGWVPAPETRPIGDSGPPAAETVFLKVTFITSVNIPKFAKEQVDSLTIEEYFCDRPDEDLLMLGSALYVPAQEGRPTTSWWEQDVVDPPLEYFFLLDVKGSAEETHHFTYHAFDLLNQPSDVCVTLLGNRYLSSGYKSDTIAIPKAMIEAALRVLPPALR